MKPVRHKNKFSDLVSGKLTSRYVAVVHTERDAWNDCFWNVLIKQTPCACIIIASGEHSYSATTATSCTVFHTDNYQTGADVINAVGRHIDQTKKPTFIFVDSLSWFLLDCPQDCEFEFFVNQVVASLMELSLNAHAHRMYVRYHAIRTAKQDNDSDALCSNSLDTMKALEHCATAFAFCDPLRQSTRTTGVDYLKHYVDLWYRRSFQAECGQHVIDQRSPAASLKPAIFERLVVGLDLVGCEIKTVRRVDGDEAQLSCTASTQPIPQLARVEAVAATVPQSTFRMTLSESERACRDKLVLPYEKQKVDSNEHAINGAGDSTITYLPDCFDDLDDDDPDDDLDI